MNSDTTTTNEEKHASYAKYKFKCARKLAFSKFTHQHQIKGEGHSCKGEKHWQCCSTVYTIIKDFHHHVSTVHRQEILDAANDILAKGSPDARWKSLRCDSPSTKMIDEQISEETKLPCDFNADSVFPWLPEKQQNTDNGKGRILLFYKYRPIHNTKHVYNWQKELCERLHLTGKIRIATEGINATVGGTEYNTGLYITAVKNHPLFSDMTDWDFKCSEGGSDAFPEGLKIGVYQEIVPMGINPKELSHDKGGHHLTVDEFHEAVTRHLTHENGSDDSLFIDCRNFYESKIGHFTGAICPDIRKFSYWPEYVEKNKELFKNRKIYMYCTGGIRCERGSAYLLSKGISDRVYQLKGGIHKYIEKYPDGHFRGKLFVFDDRYHIAANDDVLSKCSYCGRPWDKYMPCSSKHCYQLVLSCEECRAKDLTACCALCQSQHLKWLDDVDGQKKEQIKEECDCTKARSKIPVESLPTKHSLPLSL